MKAPGIKEAAKPFHRGRAFTGLAARRGARVLVLSLVFVILYLFLGQMLVSLRGAWQAALNLAVLLAAGVYLYLEGGGAGEDDVAFGEIVYARMEQGQAPGAKDDARCYHPLKGFFTAWMGVLPLLVPTVVFALIATKQVYHLGGLPGWVSALERHPEVGLALQYYREAQPVSAEGVLRVVVRLLLFPYVALFGAEDAGRMLLMERLSPILLCVVPCFYAVGYLTGPARRARVHHDIAANKKRRAAREKREKQRRREQPKRMV